MACLGLGKMEIPVLRNGSKTPFLTLKLPQLMATCKWKISFLQWSLTIDTNHSYGEDPCPAVVSQKEVSSMTCLEVICLILFHQGYLFIYYFFFNSTGPLWIYYHFWFCVFMGCLCLNVCLYVHVRMYFLCSLSSLSLFLLFIFTLFYYYSLHVFFVF